MSDGLLVGAVAVAMVVGVIGTLVPVLPGILLVWAAALVYGIVAGFGATGWVAFGIITALAIAGTAAGFLLPARAAGGAGAPRSSLLAGAALGIAGFFVIPVVGVAIGAALGIFLAERVRTGDAGAARAATVATLKGYGAGALAQLVVAVGMFGTWIVWAVAG